MAKCSGGRAGAEIAEASRFAVVGYAAVMFGAVRGGDVAARTVARWARRALDPEIAETGSRWHGTD